MSAPELVWEGAASLEEHLVPVDSLRTHPSNPRRGDVGEIAKSLGRFGQVRPVLVDADGVIVAGNHTYLAARSLDWTHIAAIPNEFASAEEARAYLLADNRLPELGGYDRAELVAQLEELEAVGRWEGTGYQADDLAHYRALEQLAGGAPAPPTPAAVAVARPPELREVVLLLTDEQHGAFGENVRVLRETYGLEGVTETILKAVQGEALRLNQGGPEGADGGS